MEYEASDQGQSQMGTTKRFEEEGPDTSSVYIEIDLIHLKQEPGLVQSVKSKPTILVKKEIAEDSNEAATMEHGASQSVKEQLQTEMTEKTVTVHTDSEINPNTLKPEPGLVHSVKSEAALLVKEEILDDSSQDFCEQQCVHTSATLVDTGDVNETCSTSLNDLLNVKYESADMDIGPTVLQHMDVHYTINKSPVDGCNESLRCSRIKKRLENKLRDSLTSQNAIMKERAVREHQLASDCRVHVMRLNVFQCDICHAVYTDKLGLLQHLHSMHACRRQSSLVAKVRKTNKQTAAENKATSQNCVQATTEADYDGAPMESLRGLHVRLQKVDLQKRLLNSTSSSNDFKCGRTANKPQLLIARNKRHQRNSRKAVTNKGTVGDPSNQSGDKGIKTKRKPFPYDVCKKGYASKAGPNLHKRSHSSAVLNNHLINYEFHTRKKLDEKFVQSGDLTKNVGHKPCQCKICQHRSILTTRMRVHTGEKPYECDTCHAKFAKLGNLNMHMRVHTGEKPYECDACYAKFARRGDLTKHKRVHTGEKPYKCDACHAQFADMGNLNRHMRVYTGEKPYECDACHAKFAKKDGLTSHMRVHTGEKPYECDACHAKFAHRHGLTGHMRVHTGQKPYECDACHAKFAGRSDLTKHKRVHTGEKPFECDACHAKFAKSGNLNRHMRVHTGEKPYECDACHAKFARMSELTKHMRVHTY